MGVEKETLRKGLLLPQIRSIWFLSHNKCTHETLSHNKNSHEKCNPKLEKAAGFVICAFFAFFTTFFLVWFLESMALVQTIDQSIQ